MRGCTTTTWAEALRTPSGVLIPYRSGCYISADEAFCRNSCNCLSARARTGPMSPFCCDVRAGAASRYPKPSSASAFPNQARMHCGLTAIAPSRASRASWRRLACNRAKPLPYQADQNPSASGGCAQKRPGHACYSQFVTMSRLPHTTPVQHEDDVQGPHVRQRGLLPSVVAPPASCLWRARLKYDSGRKAMARSKATSASSPRPISANITPRPYHDRCDWG